MNIPKSIQLTEEDNCKKFEISTYDPMMLLFQIIIILIPFLAIEFLVVKPDTLVSIAILAGGAILIGYWILANYYGKYEIILTNERVKFKSGYLLVDDKEFILSDIKNIKVVRRTGKKYSGGRTGVTTTGPDVDDYYILLNDSDYLMTPKCSKKEKEFFKYHILEMKKNIS